MNWLVRGLESSIGTKYLMAVTGLLLLLFVIGHLVGNLQLYAGQDKLNAYAAMLQSLGPLLWVVRIGLLAVLLIHLRCALKLTQMNRNARPQAYERFDPVQSTYASRTMFMSGGVILAFVIFHLLHLTVGVTHPDHFGLQDDQGRHDVYSMVVLGFQQVPVSVAYIVAMLLLGLHLGHGVSSLFQTLGWVRPKYRPAVRGLAVSLTAAIVIGNISMPLCVLLGILDLPGGTS